MDFDRGRSGSEGSRQLTRNTESHYGALNVGDWIFDVSLSDTASTFRGRCTRNGVDRPEFDQSGFGSARTAQEAGWQYVVLANTGSGGVRVKVDDSAGRRG